jgi:lactate permease
VALTAATVHGVVGLLIPLFMVSLLTRFFGANKRFSEGLAIWPFALFAAAAMIVPYWLTAWLLGPEFPSLFGGLIGLAIVITATRKGFLQPEEPWDFAPRESWVDDWMGDLSPDDAAPRQVIGTARAWAPYGVLALILVITRIPAAPHPGHPAGCQPHLVRHLRSGGERRLPVPVPAGFRVPPGRAGQLPLHRMHRAEIALAWRTAGKQISRPPRRC